jgi:hypothetical protein
MKVLPTAALAWSWRGNPNERAPVSLRESLTLIVSSCALLAGAFADAQGLRFGRRYQIEDNTPPPTEVISARWRFGTNGLIGHMGWSHNYPDSEHNLNDFVAQTTRVDIDTYSYRLLDLGSPEIFDYPFAYVSEPGEMELTEQEVVNLREYIERGGFILIDDFDHYHMDNLREEMHRVFPEHSFERLTVDHPIFDLIFRVEDLESMAPYVSGDAPVYYAFINSQGQVAIVACHNNDLANFWEWYGNPRYPLKPATDAFRMGVNFLVHSMTH